MPILFAFILIALAACEPVPPRTVVTRAVTQGSNFKEEYLGGGWYRIHDEDKRVTCWGAPYSGVSCIADKELF